MLSEAWHWCFLLLSPLFALNRQEPTSQRFSHYHSRCLLSKDEEQQQLLCLISSFSGWMQIQILFTMPDSSVSLTVSLKLSLYIFKGNRTHTKVTYNKAAWSAEIKPFLSTDHQPQMLLFSKHWALEFLPCKFWGCIFPCCGIWFWDVKAFLL